MSFSMWRPHTSFAKRKAGIHRCGQRLWLCRQPWLAREGKEDCTAYLRFRQVAVDRRDFLTIRLHLRGRQRSLHFPAAREVKQFHWTYNTPRSGITAEGTRLERRSAMRVNRSSAAVRTCQCVGCRLISMETLAMSHEQLQRRRNTSV